MNKELEAWKKIKSGYICGQGAINEFALREDERENFKTIETVLEDYEKIKKTTIVVANDEISDEDLEKLKNQRIFVGNLEPYEIKLLLDERMQKKLKALEIIKKKHVDCFKLIAIFRTSDNIEHYNQNYGRNWQLTQEEYDLLKEVLL